MLLPSALEPCDEKTWGSDGGEVGSSATPGAGQASAGFFRRWWMRVMGPPRSRGHCSHLPALDTHGPGHKDSSQSWGPKGDSRAVSGSRDARTRKDSVSFVFWRLLVKGEKLDPTLK